MGEVDEDVDEILLAVLHGVELLLLEALVLLDPEIQVGAVKGLAFLQEFSSPHQLAVNNKA